MTLSQVLRALTRRRSKPVDNSPHDEPYGDVTFVPSDGHWPDVGVNARDIIIYPSDSPVHGEGNSRA